MLKRIFGRKKYGKTSFCMKKLSECVDSSKRCYYIVPEQFTFSCEKMVTSTIGNKANLFVEVLSFTRLCNRVFRAFGGISNTYLDPVGKTLCMSRVLKSLKSELCEYSASVSDMSFAATAVGMVHEFASYNVSCADIERAIPAIEEKNASLASKLKDISLISSAYKAELKSIYGTDGESLDALADVLSKYNFFSDSVVFIDSFYGFTPQELKIVKHIIKQAQDVYITFCTNREDTDPVFQRPCEAASYAKKLAVENNVSFEDICLDRPLYDDDISYLERRFCADVCLGTAEGKSEKNGENIKIVKCKNQIDEAKAVSAMIYSLLREKNAHFRDIAICARNIASYSGIIDVFLEKSDIPYSFSAKDDLFTKPIISYILTNFDFISSWKQQSFITLLKTGLVRIEDEEAALLENYIRTWDINGKKAFQTEWYMNPSGYSAVFSEKDAAILEKVNKAKEVVMASVTKFAEDIADSCCCKDIALCVYRLMNDTSYSSDLSCEDDARFWNLTIKALDEIVRVYSYDEMTSKEFSELFKTVIGEYGVIDIPEKCDSVLIGSVDLIRSETIKYMFVLGCNNEYFPMQMPENDIFSDNEKNILSDVGINVSSPSKDCAYDEFFLAYNIFCDPYEKLCLLYSEGDLDGKPLRRSVLLDMIDSLFSRNCEVSYPFDDYFSNLTTRSSLGDEMYGIGDDTFLRAAKDLLSEDEEYKLLFSEDENDFYNGKLSKEKTSELFGYTVCSSPSRFETYSRCRFCYFNRYILKIMPATKAELDSLRTGLISHKILELFVKELAESKLSGNVYSHEKSKERIKELLDFHFEEITHSSSKNDSISKRFTYLYNRLFVILSALAVHLCDDISQSEFVPADFEVNIGLSDDTIESFPIELVGDDGEKRGELLIVGQVDRADVYRKDDKTYVRIIDYKTGPKSFKKDDVAYGFNLQMLLYLYCIALSKTKKYGENVVPAGVLYIPVRRPEVKDAVLGDDIAEKGESALRGAFKGDGVLIDDLDVLNAMDKGITGRFVPAVLASTGGFNKMRSKVESLEKMGELLDRAAQVSGKLACLMYDGNIQTNPYKKVMSSCEHCDYKSVCRIDRKNENIRYTWEEVL